MTDHLDYDISWRAARAGLSIDVNADRRPTLAGQYHSLARSHFDQNGKKIINIKTHTNTDTDTQTYIPLAGQYRSLVRFYLNQNGIFETHKVVYKHTITQTQTHIRTYLSPANIWYIIVLQDFWNWDVFVKTLITHWFITFYSQYHCLARFWDFIWNYSQFVLECTVYMIIFPFKARLQCWLARSTTLAINRWGKLFYQVLLKTQLSDERQLGADRSQNTLRIKFLKFL